MVVLPLTVKAGLVYQPTNQVGWLTLPFLSFLSCLVDMALTKTSVLFSMLLIIINDAGLEPVEMLICRLLERGVFLDLLPYLMRSISVLC